jgi:hypothetical protein
MITPQRPVLHASALAAVLTVAGLAAGAGLHGPGDGDVLRGPTVRQREKPSTLVKRDMNGQLERLEMRPEQAALDLLGLTVEQRKDADAVLAKRYVSVTALLRENWELFQKLLTARQAGAKAEEIRPLIRQFRPIAAPLLNPGLEEQVAGALPEEKRAEFKRIVDEYKAVIAAEPPPGAGGGPEMSGRAPSGAERIEVNLLLREMARSLKGIVDERREHMDAFLKAIDATPEQEAKIRELTRAAAESSRKNGAIGEPSREERSATWRKIMDVLTPEQRAKAIEARRSGL